MLTDKTKRKTVACFLAGVLILIGARNYGFGYAAYFRGERVGVVPSKAYGERLLAEAREEAARELGSGDVLKGEMDYFLKLVRKNGYPSDDSIKDRIFALSDEYTDAYAIVVDGEKVVALPTEEEARAALDGYIAKYRTENCVEEPKFDKNVEIAYTCVPLTILRSVSGAVSSLGQERVQVYSYAVDDDISLAVLSEQLGMTEERLKELNPSLGENIPAGAEIIAEQNAPLLSVMTVEAESYEEKIPYEVEQGNEERAGKEGLKRVDARVFKVNGEEISREIVAEAVMEEPVCRIEVPGKVASASGRFSRPLYGTVTSRFGRRWGGTHTGVDFSVPIGTPVKAADSGRVIFSGKTKKGYGILVKIDHGNGYVTYYAHLSKTLVKEGDTVKKGQVIAKSGNSGNSTGPHLHFEVRKNNTPIDPLKYLKN